MPGRDTFNPSVSEYTIPPACVLSSSSKFNWSAEEVSSSPSSNKEPVTFSIPEYVMVSASSLSVITFAAIWTFCRPSPVTSPCISNAFSIVVSVVSSIASNSSIVDKRATPSTSRSSCTWTLFKKLTPCAKRLGIFTTYSKLGALLRSAKTFPISGRSARLSPTCWDVFERYVNDRSEASTRQTVTIDTVLVTFLSSFLFVRWLASPFGIDLLTATVSFSGFCFAFFSECSCTSASFNALTSPRP